MPDKHVYSGILDEGLDIENSALNAISQTLRVQDNVFCRNGNQQMFSFRIALEFFDDEVFRRI